MLMGGVPYRKYGRVYRLVGCPWVFWIQDFRERRVLGWIYPWWGSHWWSSFWRPPWQGKWIYRFVYWIVIFHLWHLRIRMVFTDDRFLLSCTHFWGFFNDNIIKCMEIKTYQNRRKNSFSNHNCYQVKLPKISIKYLFFPYCSIK